MIVGRILQVRLRGHAENELTKSAWERINEHLIDVATRRNQYEVILAPTQKDLLQALKWQVNNAWLPTWKDRGLKREHLEFTYSEEELRDAMAGCDTFQFWGVFSTETGGWHKLTDE